MVKDVVKRSILRWPHLYFLKRYTHVRVYSLKGSVAYLSKLVNFFLSLRKIWYAVNKEKGFEKLAKISNKKPVKIKRFSRVFGRGDGERIHDLSRTRRATSCATPRFFNFLSIFVSGQTCGQATYFERFVEKCTARIVSVVKGFRGSKKSTKESPCGCPERNCIDFLCNFGWF